jgi:hypothetical protein
MDALTTPSQGLQPEQYRLPEDPRHRRLCCKGGKSSPDETIPRLVGKITTEGVETVDVYHCNSIDVDPLNQNDDSAGTKLPS